MSEQVYTVGVSPAQRFALLNLAFGTDEQGRVRKQYQGQKGRVFRRFFRAFALDRLREVLATHENRYDPAVHRATEPAAFVLTIENVEFALELYEEVTKTPFDELTLGPLCDSLEDIKAKRPYAAPEGLAPFDPAADDWSPKGAVTDGVEQRIAEWLRNHGELTAAELVERGGWDRTHGGRAAVSAPS
jgi:hypothetical protein